MPFELSTCNGNYHNCFFDSDMRKTFVLLSSVADARINLRCGGVDK
jgi:hypothetical protein